MLNMRPPFAMLVLATSLVAALLMCVAPAAAQTRASALPYQEAIREGIREFDLGHFNEARELFRRAHALDPNARTLRGLGWVEFELRNYGEAATLLEQALASTVKPLDDKQRAEAQKVLDRARAFLGKVHVATEPTAATVVVDGAVVELGPAGTLVLEVGDHVFEFHAEGRMPVKQKVTVKGGETETVRVRLRPALDSASVAKSTQTPSEKGAPVIIKTSNERTDTPIYKKWWFWTATGVAVVAAVTTTAVLASRDDAKGERAFTTSNTPSGATISALRWGTP